VTRIRNPCFPASIFSCARVSGLPNLYLAHPVNISEDSRLSVRQLSAKPKLALDFQDLCFGQPGFTLGHDLVVSSNAVLALLLVKHRQAMICALWDHLC